MSSPSEEQQHINNNSNNNDKNEKRKHNHDQPDSNKRTRLITNDGTIPVFHFMDEMDNIDSDLEEYTYQKYAKKRKNMLMDERQRKYLRRFCILNESDSEEEELYNDLFEYNPQLVYIFPFLNREYTSFCV